MRNVECRRRSYRPRTEGSEPSGIASRALDWLYLQQLVKISRARGAYRPNGIETICSGGGAASAPAAAGSGGFYGAPPNGPVLTLVCYGAAQALLGGTTAALRSASELGAHRPAALAPAAAGKVS